MEVTGNNNNRTEEKAVTDTAAPEKEAGNTMGKEDYMETLRNKYRQPNGKIYEISTVLHPDDESEVELDYIFRKPATPSYDRYVKTSGVSGTRALKTFVLDNIIEEQNEELREILEEYPAMAISLGEKLLDMLGLSKETQVKKL